MSTPATVRPLTLRQQQVVALILEHKSYAEIGAALGCSEHTVAAHCRQIALVLPEGFGDLPPRMGIYAWAVAVAHDAALARAVAEALGRAS